MAARGRGDDELVQEAWRLVGHLEGFHQSLDGLLESGELAAAPGAAAVVSDTARRLEHVIRALRDELDRGDRAEPSLVRSILAWGGRVAGRLAVAEGAIAAAELFGPPVLAAALGVSRFLLDLDVGLVPAELWLPALAGPVAATGRETPDDRGAPQPRTVTVEEFLREGRGRLSPEDRALLDQVPEGMEVVTDGGEIVTDGGRPVFVPVESVPSEERFGRPTVSATADEGGRSYQVDPILDDGPVGEPRLGPLDDDAEGG